MIVKIWKTGELEKWHQMTKVKHKKEQRTCVKKEKPNIQTQKDIIIGMDQLCRKGLGDSSENKPNSEENYNHSKTYQCSVMCKTLETNSSALLGMRSQEEQHNQFRAPCLKKSMDRLKKLQQRVTGNFKIPTFEEGLKKNRDWLGYKTEVNKSELVTVFKYLKGCDNCPEGMTDHNQINLQQDNFAKFS